MIPYRDWFAASRYFIHDIKICNCDTGNVFVR
jgi:hypothetical protein